MRDPRRLLVENVINLRRFEAGLRQRVQKELERALRDIGATIMRDYSGMTRFHRARMLALFKRTDAALATAYKKAGRAVDKEFEGLARLQARFSEEVLRSVGSVAGFEIATTRLTAGRLATITDFPIQGLSLGEWWEKAGRDAALKMRQHVQLGLIQGEPITAIVNRIAPAGASAPAPSVLLTVRRQTEALVRTAVTAISTESQFAALAANDAEVTDSYQYVATLDDRTTEICAALDGQIFRYDDEAAPRPPMHINCRSAIIPVINWEKLGVKAPENMQQLSRASMGGPITYKTYSGWLRDQPAGVQDEVLGPSRGKLFRAGKVSLRDLVRNDGTTLTLPQLAKKMGIPMDEVRS